MSSADGRGPGGFVRGHWPWLVALAALVIIAGMLTGVAVRPLLGTPVGGPDGGDGVGDPYFPTAGGGGYDARHYRTELAYDEPTRGLTGTTTVTAVATTELASLHLDLDLLVDRAELNGIKVEFTQTGRDVHVHSSRLLRPGDEFEVRLDYAGRPAELDSESLHVTGRELVIADEPFSAPLWFPSNDHPSDPATMETLITVPADLQAMSSGALISRDTESDPATDTWHWRSAEPMATYLNFLAIGPFDLRTGQENGRPFLYAISRELEPALAQGAEQALRATPGVVAELEAIWGPYPFGEVGGIAPAADFEYGALETQPRPIYNTRTLVSEPTALLVHEYAHQWFGNKVTLRQWVDIVMNESYAAYSEWLIAERRGRRSANDIMKRIYAAAPADHTTWTVPIDDPGPDHLFSNVYTRGPMALQALRNLIGDDAFFALGRAWASRSGPHSFEDWQVLAQQHSRIDLTHFFEVWYAGTSKPAPTAENGFR